MTSGGEFSGIGQSLSGKVLPSHLHITNALWDEKGLELQVHCLPSRPKPPRILDNRKPPNMSTSQCVLSIIMYGPKELSDDIDAFFQYNDIFIQDPLNCDRVVRYHNPQRLSSADPNNCQWTLSLSPGGLTLEGKDVSTGPDILDLLDSQVDLAETPQPPAIETLLLRYDINTHVHGPLPLRSLPTNFIWQDIKNRH